MWPERIVRPVLEQGITQRFLDLGREPFQAGGAPPHLGQLVRLGLGPAGLLGRAGALGGEQERREPAIDLLVVGPRQARGHPPPEDPPLGPALHVLGVPDALMEDRPERLDPDLVEREAASRPEEEPGEVEPARLVLGALEPLVGQVAERLPERPQGRGRPLVARRVEDLLEPLDQSRRAGLAASRGGDAAHGASNAARIAAIAASISDCSMIDPVGLIAGDRSRGGRAGRPGRGAGSGAASGGRRSATGTRARSCRPRSPAPPG